MTVQTTNNTISYIAVEGQALYTFDYLVLSAAHVFIEIDGAPYTGAFTVTGIGNQNGGEVTLDDPTTPEEAGGVLVIARIVPMTQEIDYTSYDGFPAETHEAGLDKGIMIAQQNAEESNRAFRFPVGDAADTVVPVVAERANRYMAFDDDGNIVMFDAQPADRALIELTVQSGDRGFGEDSRDVLQVEYQSDGLQHPRVGFRNINKANGALQLNDQGKVPFDNLGFAGIQLRGPYRGDDLCDKPNDDPGDCSFPDTRNPSERFPDLDPIDPDDTGKFGNGDTFILTFEDPEVSGTMNLFTGLGDTVPSIVPVNPRDGIVFLTGWDQNGDDLPNVEKGWYYVPKLVDTGDASFVIYDDTGNSYVLGTNVQVALDAVDDEFILRDNYFTTQKNLNREAFDLSGGDLNASIGTGFFFADGATANTPAAGEFSVVNTRTPNGLISQTATSLGDNGVYVRNHDGAVWSDWDKLLYSSDITDLIVPIGIIRSFNNSTDPNVLYPGTTWSQIQDNRFLMSQTPGATGGSNSMLLTQAELPSHGHVFVGDLLAPHAHTISTTNGSGSVGFVELGISSITNLVTSSVSGGTPSGTVQNTGGNGAFDNRPAWIGVAMWERTA